jgi:hypothetical protein
MIKHQTVELSLESSLVPIGLLTIKQRSLVWEFGGVASGFVVDDTDAV